MHDTSLLLKVGVALAIPQLAIGEVFTPDWYTNRAPLDEPLPSPSSYNDTDLGDQIILGSYSDLDDLGIISVDLTQHFVWSEVAPEYFSSDLLVTGLPIPGSPFTSVVPAVTETTYSLTELDLSYNRCFAPKWFFEAYLNQDIYRFDSDYDTNFENTELGVGVMHYIPQWNDLVLYAQYDLQLLTRESWSELGFAANRVKLGAHQEFYSWQGHSLNASLEGVYHIVESLNTDRRGVSLRLSDHWEIMHRLELRPYYQISYNDYTNINSLSQYVGADLTWKLHRNIQLAAYYSYKSHEALDNTSNSTIDFEYEGSTAGVNLQFEYRF